MSKKRFFSITLFLILFVPLLLVGTYSAESNGHLATKTYYLDCDNGRDSNSGLSTSDAWRSLDKANEATLFPGDQLLLKRNCTFAGRLILTWHGTAENKILVSAYGGGAKPKIQNRVSDIENDNHHINVRVTGSHIIVEKIQTTIINPMVDVNCENQTRGYFVGFAITHLDSDSKSGKWNTIRNVEAQNHTIGAFIGPGSSENQVFDSYFHHNNVMQLHTLGKNDELGAWGMLLHGDRNEIAHNVFERNRAWCSYDGIERPSNSIELYTASDNIIHHNTSLYDRVFSELGTEDGNESKNNLFAFNLAISDLDDARFIVSRGASHQFGPVETTRIVNNTVYYTGQTSQGIVCGAGCDSTILIVRNNILWAEEKAIFASGNIIEEYNIYWSSNGDPQVQLMSSAMHSSSKIVNPKFKNKENLDFRLQETSQAIDNGKVISWILATGIPYTPIGDSWDIGRHEFEPLLPASTPTMTKTPVLTNTPLPTETSLPPSTPTVRPSQTAAPTQTPPTTSATQTLTQTRVATQVPTETLPPNTKTPIPVTPTSSPTKSVPTQTPIASGTSSPAFQDLDLKVYLPIIRGD